MPAGPRNPNAASHPGYQFALAQGMMAAQTSLAARGDLSAYAHSFPVPSMGYAPSPAIRCLEGHRRPTGRLSVIRKYGFGGRR